MWVGRVFLDNVSAKVTKNDPIKSMSLNTQTICNIFFLGMRSCISTIFKYSNSMIIFPLWWDFTHWHWVDFLIYQVGQEKWTTFIQDNIVVGFTAIIARKTLNYTKKKLNRAVQLVRFDDNSNRDATQRSNTHWKTIWNKITGRWTGKVGG